ncbi:TetR/AcrR family transcriptional regulator [Sphingobium sp. JS3065]|uniref:TetR/AcrR family transcriptional regulator n=1 Tax=Sphingobium sp. JS3065 TaxID=2970925 RepID=UPI002264F0FA|nr:TetR/AcrR family transcriptional regulator [Sphingobium sp. JS3065]UZW57444.1 TetR/AcrR family transcriptional regulator [Sphingobium sp. JS3065]
MTTLPASDPAQISNRELYAVAGMTSASAPMFERRRRILRETQHMLAEQGLGGFSTMELSKRSGVAQRTIFNAFGNRDNLVALAIRFYFEEFNQALANRFDVSTLDGALGKLTATTLRNLQLRNYMTAIVSLHFSPSAPAQVRAVTLAIGAGFFRDWLDSQQFLPADVDLDRLTRHIAHLEYAALNDWLVGAVDEGFVVDNTLQAVLEMLVGALRGEVRAQLEEYLADIREAGPLSMKLKADGAEAIATLSLHMEQRG